MVGRGQDKFIFRVETTGVLPPEAVVSTALEVLQRKLATISQSLVSGRGDDVMQIG